MAVWLRLGSSGKWVIGCQPLNMKSLGSFAVSGTNYPLMWYCILQAPEASIHRIELFVV